MRQIDIERFEKIEKIMPGVLAGVEEITRINIRRSEDKMDKYIIEEKSQYSLKYSDDVYTMNVTIDDMREPVPQIVLVGVYNKQKQLYERLPKEVKFEIFKRICAYLKSQGYIKIYTEEFGYIDV